MVGWIPKAVERLVWESSKGQHVSLVVMLNVTQQCMTCCMFSGLQELLPSFWMHLLRTGQGQLRRHTHSFVPPLPQPLGKQFDWCLSMACSRVLTSSNKCKGGDRCILCKRSVHQHCPICCFTCYLHVWGDSLELMLLCFDAWLDVHDGAGLTRWQQPPLVWVSSTCFM